VGLVCAALAGCYVGNDLQAPPSTGPAADAGAPVADAGADAGVPAALFLTAAAGATVDAAGVAFAPREVDTLGGPTTLTLTNGTDRDVTLGADAVAVQSGPPVEFSLVRAPALPATLHPGEALTFDLSFSPVDFGARTARLTVASNAIPPRLTVALTGVGAPPAAAAGQPLWAAGGDLMQRYTSPDGLAFTSRGADAPCPAGNPCDDYIHQLAFGAGQVVAVGAGVSDRGGGLGTRSLWSRDGVTWSELVDASAPHGSANAVAYGNGRFVLVAGTTTYRSTDGTTWERADGASPGVTHGSLIYGRGRFVLVGDNNSQGGLSRVSDDGLTWSGGQSGPTADGGLVPPRAFGAYGRGVYVAGWGCVAGGPSALYASSDGVSWSLAWQHAGRCLGGVAFLPGGHFLAVASDTTVQSDDGLTWTEVPYTPGRAPGAVGPLAVAPAPDGGATWVIAGGTALYTSSDGLGWSPSLTGAAQGLGTVSFGHVTP
jgi:hypothetical protein